MKKGLTHVYTGDGKGKTTAALGLALRAAGCGYRAAIYQFCKREPAGELQALKAVERVKVARAACEVIKSAWEMTPEEKAQWVEAQQSLFDEACEELCEGSADLVVLDEITGAVLGGAIDEKQLLYLVERKRRNVELVLTGRGASPALIAAADYVTEMRAVRHPYERGIPSRRGIEY